jgi:AraC-like DNA-binding protein
MDSTNLQQAEREVQRAHANRDELIERIASVVRDDGTAEPLEGIQFRRASAPTEIGHGVSFPAVCVVAQGSKEILLGDTCYRYDPAHYLIVTAALPIASRITAASPECPYLRVLLTLEPTLIGSVLVEAGHLAPPSQSDVRAIDVSPLDADLLDAVVRLVRLVDAPIDARVLAPLVKREIVYRLLMDAQGSRLHQIAALGGSTPTHRIAAAIARIRRDFAQPLRIEDLARAFGMSVSGFHHHFRAVTALSPVQFQKHLRLQEARRLMLSEGHDATSAGSRVGYSDASHFTREYKRLFGAPPMHDVAQLRNGTKNSAGL